MPRYSLYNETKFDDKDNILIASSESSAYYSACTTYLISYNKHSDLKWATLLATNSRLQDAINFPNILDTVPK